MTLGKLRILRAGFAPQPKISTSAPNEKIIRPQHALVPSVAAQHGKKQQCPEV